MTYEAHPLAEIFPLLQGAELQELADDIAQRGLLESIVLHEGRVLDGRNRLAACAMAGVEPRFCEFDGSDALGYVVSKNLKRRHLSDSQRAMIAARLADHPGASAKGVPKAASGHTTKAKAAELLNVSASRVRMARKVINRAPAEVVAKVDSGEMKVGAAYNAVMQPKPAQLARHTVSHAPNREADKHLLIEAREWIDSIAGRRQEVALITRPMRLELVMSFARALQVAPPGSRVEERSDAGVAEYA